MKVIAQHLDLRFRRRAGALIEERLRALRRGLHIFEARVHLDHQVRINPPFGVHIRLVTAGPDLIAGSRDYTLDGAIDKVLRRLELTIEGRLASLAQREGARRNRPRTRRAVEADDPTGANVPPPPGGLDVISPRTNRKSTKT
jgi:hypothetical protein